MTAQFTLDDGSMIDACFPFGVRCRSVLTNEQTGAKKNKATILGYCRFRACSVTDRDCRGCGDYSPRRSE